MSSRSSVVSCTSATLVRQLALRLRRLVCRPPAERRCASTDDRHNAVFPPPDAPEPSGDSGGRNLPEPAERNDLFAPHAERFGRAGGGIGRAHGTEDRFVVARRPGPLRRMHGRSRRRHRRDVGARRSVTARAPRWPAISRVSSGQRRRSSVVPHLPGEQPLQHEPTHPSRSSEGLCARGEGDGMERARRVLGVLRSGRSGDDRQFEVA